MKEHSPGPAPALQRSLVFVSQAVTQPLSTSAAQNGILGSCLSDDPGPSILRLSGNQILRLMAEIKVSQDHSSPSIDPVKEDAGATHVRSLPGQLHLAPNDTGSGLPSVLSQCPEVEKRKPHCRNMIGAWYRLQPFLDPSPHGPSLFPCDTLGLHFRSILFAALENIPGPLQGPLLVQCLSPGRGGCGSRPRVFPAPHKNWKELLDSDLSVHCWIYRKEILLPSLLTFQTTPTTAQLAIELVPFSVAKGGDVLLLVHNLPQNTIGYKWFKGERSDSSREIAAYVISTMVTTPGPVFSDRETIYPNGSLLLRNVTQQDTGYYTLQALKDNFWSEDASGQFRVYQLVTRPSIQASKTTVTEQDSVVLTCLSSDPGLSTQWVFNNHSLWLTERMKLSRESSNLTIDPVRREDAGEYWCEVSNMFTFGRSNTLRLTVISEEKNTGLPAGAVAGIVAGVLVGAALAVVLLCFLLLRRNRRPSIQHDLGEHQQPVSIAGLKFCSSFTSQDTLLSSKTAVPIYEVSVGDETTGAPGPVPAGNLAKLCDWFWRKK
ncbi:PREDICTED: carcinoembryonic antigen-related cell adhesion molecule 21-like [Chinchilla lanigera]|uniref:carcinoembryonic antigen-related cell adhesion molecule 21-like n=1 Tax=Chinchilla lanigera TaxID=34839 RepID=UPI0006986C58|nr:PREDICTED: carcinoembryonic antigen-related cell adhesion molecule 21-like [Chinchilla lanigera]